MNLKLIIKVTVVWLLIVVFAIINGVIRESVLPPFIGMQWALPISGISLSLMVLFTCYFTVDWMGCNTKRLCLQIGLQWVLMTLAFELLFGHYVVNKSWSEILQVFNLGTGNLFTVVLVACFIGPWLMLKMKASSKLQKNIFN